MALSEINPSKDNLKKNIRTWWDTNFSDQNLYKLKKFNSGQSNPCYLINSNLVLKIYKPKNALSSTDQKQHFVAASQFQPVLNSSGLAPKILGVYPDDYFLGADAILMEFIQGQDLSKALIAASDIEKFYAGRAIGSILKTVHETDSKTDQSFDTQELLAIAQSNLEKAQSMTYIPEYIRDLANQFITDYTPRIIVDDQVIVHGDVHPENFIKSKNKLLLIDWDLANIGMRFFESRMLLHMALMPANLVAKELEQHYPEGSLIDLLKGVLEVYPEILPPKYLPEIKIIALAEILSHFDLDNTVVNKITPVKRASFMFDQIFVKKFLEDLILV